jgi:hypothetical protein
MIIDTLTIAGILGSALYLLTFVWFGKETLKVEEVTADHEVRPAGANEARCTEY